MLVFEDEEGYGTMELLSAKANEEDWVVLAITILDLDQCAS